MQKWQKTGQTEQKVGFRTIVSKEFELPNGQRAEFTTSNRAGTANVGVIALTPDNQMIIARQFRPGPERIMDELPGGMVDDGEDPETAARRELAEETGYTTDEPLKYLGEVCRDAYSNAKNHYFLARNCLKSTDQHLDDHEFIEVVLMAPADVIDSAKQGGMSDAAGLLLAYDALRELERV